MYLQSSIKFIKIITLNLFQIIASFISYVRFAKNSMYEHFFWKRYVLKFTMVLPKFVKNDSDMP